MTTDELFAESIRIWKKRAETGEWGDDDCPFCKVFDYFPCEVLTGKSCPIKIITGKSQCRATHFYDARDVCISYLRESFKFNCSIMLGQLRAMRSIWRTKYEDKKCSAQ